MGLGERDAECKVHLGCQMMAASLGTPLSATQTGLVSARMVGFGQGYGSME